MVKFLLSEINISVQWHPSRLTCERVPRCDAALAPLPLGAELLLAQPVLHLLLRRQLQLQLLLAVLLPLARGRARGRRNASRQRRGRLCRGLQRGREEGIKIGRFNDKRGPKSAERTVTLMMLASSFLILSLIKLLTLW